MNRHRYQRLLLGIVAVALSVALAAPGLWNQQPVFAGSKTTPLAAASPGAQLPGLSQPEPLGDETLKAEVRLNRLIYAPGDTLTAVVSVADAAFITGENLALVIAGTETKDMEVLPLATTGNPQRLFTSGKILCQISNGGALKVNDGVLNGKPNEKFVAFFAYKENAIAKPSVATDFGIFFDPQFKGSAVIVEPKIALTADEKQPPADSRPFGTALVKNSLPVQLATEELLFCPTDEAQLKQFLAETGSQITGKGLTFDSGNRQLTWYKVAVNPQAIPAAFLPQLRAFLNAKETLYVSTPEVAQICALTLYWQLEGYVVNFNPRVLFHSQPTTRDARDGSSTSDVFSANSDRATPIIANEIFGLQKAWAFMALWERDQTRIPVAFIDHGFAPNEDFRGYSNDLRQPGIFQRDVQSGRTGPGTSVSTPTTPNSGIGGLSWHGNGVVSTASGLLNNGFGFAGTGGQVVTPMLYRMDGLGSYAFELGVAIAFATADGASIINISAGFPCRAVSSIGSLGIDFCSGVGRQPLCPIVDAIVHTAAATVCTAALVVPLIGPFIAPAICAAAHGAAITVSVICYSTFFDIARDPMRLAIEAAQRRGVTVVASTGNDFFSSLGELCRLIACDNHDTTAWQIVPASLPHVICVGAADPIERDGALQNREFYGDRVDVWAPIDYPYYAPPTITRVVASATQIRNPHDFAGTSAAAPYITGVIAMMQAANPALDPRTATLTPAERAAIPALVRDILRETASVNGAILEGRDTPTHTVEVRLGDHLRNVVNVYAALRRAATYGAGATNFPLASFDGIDASYGFDEEGLRSNDTEVTAVRVRRDGQLTFTGTILHLPAALPAGSAYQDRDCYKWIEDSTTGRYVGGQVQLRLPRRSRFGDLRVNGQPGTLLSRDDFFETWGYDIPDHTGGEEFSVVVAGATPSQDNVYSLTFIPPRRLEICDAASAIALGDATRQWGPYEIEVGGGAAGVSVSRLSLPTRILNAGVLSQCFNITRLPEFTGPGRVLNRNLRVRLNAPSNLSVFVLNAEGARLRPLSHTADSLLFERAEPGMRLVVTAGSTLTAPVAYTLELSVEAAWCNLPTCR